MNKRVTGLGGIFFKSENPKAIKEWYAKHLGIGEVFKWHEVDNVKAEQPAQTIWSPFKKETDYFAPSEKQFMFNYRVENLEELMEVLKSEGVQQVGEIQSFSYGKFGWILDPEGNKIELWEPID
jgi:predicted enzyme related to lactoylglutathione lyase